MGTWRVNIYIYTRGYKKLLGELLSTTQFTTHLPLVKSHSFTLVKFIYFFELLVL